MEKMDCQDNLYKESEQPDQEVQGGVIRVLITNTLDLNQVSNENKHLQEVMSHDSAVKEIKELIDYLKDLGVSEAQALRLLIENKWNKEKARDKIAERLAYHEVEQVRDLESVYFFILIV